MNAMWERYDAGETAHAEEKKRPKAAATAAGSDRSTHPTAKKRPTAASFSCEASAAETPREAKSMARVGTDGLTLGHDYDTVMGSTAACVGVTNGSASFQSLPLSPISGGPSSTRNQRRAAYPPPSPRSSKPVANRIGAGAMPSSPRPCALLSPRRHSEQKLAEAQSDAPSASGPSAPATLDVPTRGSECDGSDDAAATGDGPASSSAPTTVRRARPSRPSPPRSPRTKTAQQTENAKRLLDEAKAHEQASKARVAWLRRYAHEAKRQAATEVAAKKKAALAAALRAEKLRGPLARTAPASDEEVAALSTRLNLAMHRAFPPPATPSWAKLFREADEDESGLLSYSEFAQLVRARLELPPSGAGAVSDRLLRAAWRALDQGSGLLKAGAAAHSYIYICVCVNIKIYTFVLRHPLRLLPPPPPHLLKGGFFCFMRRGELPPNPDARSPRERVKSQKSKGAKELRAFKDKLWEHPKLGPAHAASAEEVRLLSRALNRQLSQLYPPPATPSWYKLYKLSDEDGNGQISYSKFTALVRTPGQGLGMPEEHISSLMLSRVWAAINTDASGLVSAGEFGAFMRRGEDALLSREVGRLEEQKELQARIDHGAEAARRKLRQASSAMHQRARLFDVEAYTLAAQIVKAKGPGWRPGGESGLPASATAGPSPGRRLATAQPTRTQSARRPAERRPPPARRQSEGMLVSPVRSPARKPAARLEELDELRAWCEADEIGKPRETAAPWRNKSQRDQHTASPALPQTPGAILLQRGAL